MERAGVPIVRSLVAVMAASVALSASAADVQVVGLFNGKALVVVNGGKPRMLAAGESSPEGVRLVSADSEAAMIEFSGQRRRLTTGDSTRLGASAPGSAVRGVRLTADARGHFIADGAINGNAVRVLVDTGASSVALSVQEAKRLGINYLAGQRSHSSTANGVVPVYKVKLDSVRLGDIALNNVDAVVVDGAGLNVILLGMSFLNRMQMKQDGDTLTLVRRF
jgi:aspartyl protease family protein